MKLFWAIAMITTFSLFIATSAKQTHLCNRKTVSLSETKNVDSLAHFTDDNFHFNLIQ